jgi:hypothetical protein
VIIKSDRVTTAASKSRLADHLFRGQENAAIAVLRGSERELFDLFRDARLHGSAYCVRHWIVAPLQPVSRDQLFAIVNLLADEFKFDAARAIVVEHTKQRATPDAFDRHWHICLGEVDPVTGKVMSSSHDHPRHEYIARLSEAVLGHPFQRGAHHRSVLARLRREDKGAIADSLAATFPTDDDQASPREAFTRDSHQMLKRNGVDLPAIRASVKAAWDTATDAESLRAALTAEGLVLSMGQKAGEWIVECEGRLIGSLRRLCGARKSEITQKMEAQHGNTTDRSADNRADDPRRHQSVARGSGDAKGGGVADDDAPGGSAGFGARSGGKDTVDHTGRDRPAAGQRGSAPYPGSGGEARSSASGDHERQGLISQLGQLNSQLQSALVGATQLAISHAQRNEAMLAAAERSANERVALAKADVEADDETVRLAAEAVHRDKARSDETIARLVRREAEIETLERRHSHTRWLPHWMRFRYAAQRRMLVEEIEGLRPFSKLHQLRASASSRKLDNALAGRAARKARATVKLAHEMDRFRRVLRRISIARWLTEQPSFRFAPPAALYAATMRLESLRADGQSPPPSELERWSPGRP